MLRILDISGPLGEPGESSRRSHGPPGETSLDHAGDYTGQSFVIIGATAAMLMAMAGWDRFWIANVIYLCFILSAILGSVTKIIAYRTSFPW